MSLRRWVITSFLGGETHSLERGCATSFRDNITPLRR